MKEISKDIYWVGVRDWELRTFHGHEYSTHKGSTYNSYLVMDEKIALVDTVWDPFKVEYVDYLEQNVGLDKIDLIVINHTEPDHGGSLGYLMSRLNRDVPIYCTKNGSEMIKKHHHQEWNFNIMKTGDSVKLGKYELVFVEMPMLHWPDSMLTYVKGANVVLSNDAFGQHYATTSLFNDEVDECELFQEAIKYYANILTPFSARVKKKIEEIQELNLPIEIIAPSHGVIWRKNPMQIVEKYYQWSQEYNEGFAVVVYDTMWQGTKEMAHAIADGIAQKGLTCKIYNAATTDKNDLLTEVFKAKGVLVGSPTVNNGLLYAIGALLEEFKGLKFKGKLGAAFGSYGWSGESPKLIQQKLTDAGFQVVQDPIQFKYQPLDEELQKCKEFGEAFAAALLS